MATRAQAENYLNTFPPDEQARIRATWGGQDRVLEWYENALAAGAVTPGSPPPTAPWHGQDRRTQAPADVDTLIDGWIQNIDNRYSRAQWRAWSPFYDPNCPPDRPFNPDPHHWEDAGLPSGPAPAAGTCLEKPIDWGGPQAAGAGGGGAGRGAQVGQGIAGGLLHSPATTTPGVEGTVEFRDLQRSLEANLLGREGIFGLTDARTGSSGTYEGDIYGQSLTGGGLWWGGDKGMFDGRRRQPRRAATASAPAPTRPAPETAPTPAEVPTPGGLNSAMYQKFPRRGPFDRWMVR